MPAPSIIDARTFLAQTRLGVFHGRKSLENLDTLLTNCTGLDAKGIDQRIALMAAIIEACNKWLTTKAVKPTEVEDANTAKRRGPVEALLVQAKKRFAYERFEQKKQKARRLPVPPLTKGLQSGYIPERVQFMRQRADLRAAGTYTPTTTISPIGGSYAHEMHGLAAAGRLPIPARPGPFGGFTVEDYEAYKATDFSLTQAPYVHYMRKRERLSNMLLVEGGLLFHQGAKFTTGAQTNIFVMDVYGNLFFQKATVPGRMVGDRGETSQFNHSSLNAGNEVICAGVIQAVEGKLTSISNESGHYAPSHLNLAECLKYLVADGLDISETTVSILTAAADSPYGPWSASVFLANPDACLAPLPVTRARAGGGAPPPPLIV